MLRMRFGFVFGVALGLVAAPMFAASPVPVPQVSGPIAAPDVPGSPSHNYIFFASNHELAARGYVEEEFFIKGSANTYDIQDDLKAGVVKDTDHPYYTRIVVRRPADPKRFNGTALVEWYNVTNLFDAENMWFFDWEHMMREGYIWVGVSAQTVGIDAKKWNPRRYDGFDVGKVVANPGAPGPDADAMSYDIFSQAGQALRHPSSVDMLHGLRPKLFLAIGESQGAGRLATYVNSIHPMARVYDGFLLLSPVGRRVRDDLVSPVFKVDTEHDVVTGDAAVRQPDTAKFRSWEVAGAAHVDQHLRASREVLELRDNLVSLEANMSPLCAVPQVGTRVPTRYVVASAFDKLVVWAGGGAAPPSAPPLNITEVKSRPAQSVLARTKDGLAEGGIQLSELSVPTQINMGVGKPAKTDNGPSREAIGAGACVRWGYSLDMSTELLNARYPTHAGYVAKVRQAADDNLKKGFILPYDAATTIREAEESHIGAQ